MADKHVLFEGEYARISTVGAACKVTTVTFLEGLQKWFNVKVFVKVYESKWTDYFWFLNYFKFFIELL